jgi:hypothetical protein
VVFLTIVALASAACDRPAPAPSTGASATKPAPKQSTNGSMVVDDFGDPSSGWDTPPIAVYRSGNLVLGDFEPGSTFIPAPIAFHGSRIVKTTASIDGPGPSAIGVFCQADLDRYFSGYIGSVDTAARTVKVSRVRPPQSLRPCGRPDRRQHLARRATRSCPSVLGRERDCQNLPDHRRHDGRRSIRFIIARRSGRWCVLLSRGAWNSRRLRRLRDGSASRELTTPSATPLIHFPLGKLAYLERVTVMPVIQAVPMIMRMMPSLRRGSGARSTTPHQKARVPGASHHKGILSLAAGHRIAINERAPRPLRIKPVLLIFQGLTFE